MSLVDVTERFVETVRLFPILYNKSNPEFKDKQAKDNRWDIIGSEFGLSGEFIVSTFWTCTACRLVRC